MSNIVSRTEELVRPICMESNADVVDVEYLKEGQNFFLRVYVDSPGGIDIDQCAEIAEKLSEQLDQQNYIEDEYILEVSSPGAERPLKTKEHVSQAIDSYINVKTYQMIEGQKEFEGYLKKFEDEVLTVEVLVKTRKKMIEIPYDKAAKIRLAIKF